MALMQQLQYLNISKNSFHILFSARGIVSYREIIPSRLYIRLKGTCSLFSRALTCE